MKTAQELIALDEKNGAVATYKHNQFQIYFYAIIALVFSLILNFFSHLSLAVFVVLILFNVIMWVYIFSQPQREVKVYRTRIEYVIDDMVYQTFHYNSPEMEKIDCLVKSNYLKGGQALFTHLLGISYGDILLYSREGAVFKIEDMKNVLSLYNDIVRQAKAYILETENINLDALSQEANQNIQPKESNNEQAD